MCWGLTLLKLEVPHVAPAERLQVSPLAQGFCRVVARYGFMEEPNVPEVLRLCREHVPVACWGFMRDVRKPG